MSTAPIPIEELHQDDADARDLARNQVLMREVNEHIRSFLPAHGLGEDLEITCECTTGDCENRLSVSIEEYDAVRAVPTRFLVSLEHVRDEHVVASERGFVVVEQHGPGADVAIRLDPRRRVRLQG